jgi:hypothetical protein
MNLAFMRCTRCHAQPELREWLLRGPDGAWHPPRGWAGSLAPGRRDLLVLSTNPGHPLRAEAALMATFPSTVAAAHELSEVHAKQELSFVASMYRQRRGTAFHTRSVQVARSLLWLINRAAGVGSLVKHVTRQNGWFDRVWFSDVVKCSTALEMGSPGIPDLARACRPLLERELSAFTPTLVATLGAAAGKALAESGVTAAHPIAVPHPSGHQWRKITDGSHDDWLQQACSALGLDWSQERRTLQNVREVLLRDPWTATPDA